ncbi:MULTISPECIES: MFS transporter [Sphingobium]|jgi:FSR family fosmidomycin resistance protein-like MFS transporter|uniref:MFS transporter n=1 Tax=Sphingobium yanoikuyae TaxID=13690 RepID=A0A0J9FK43_SPHYA|nr:MULTISPECIES: MFS transporter [Sphingobium]ATP19833.1 MFS transporter [Sphingobium yanoikuyae]KMW28860.1 Fosmidomycin resistance protein [Sphingobium yanoikuyae]TKV44618.1 Fosmidomycin resistance protein [Sphingobium sp. MP9-4]
MKEIRIEKAGAQLAAGGTAFGVIVAISFCHLLNDMMQSLLPAIYPGLKSELHLSFGQIGMVTLVYQITASILQPMIGLYADKRPTPMALPGGTLFSLAGLTVLSIAHSYGLVLVGAALLGVGSSVFHPESSRVARMAAGGRHGLAQSLFQVGGNAGQALGPLAAALVVVRWGQSSLAFFALLALLSGAVLWNVANWYRHHGLSRLQVGCAGALHIELPRGQAARGIAILLALIFSKYVYLASLTSYYTFYLIQRFDLSVQNAQLHLFAFLAAVAVGTVAGGPLGDRFGRKYVIWFSILGALPFSLALPYAGLFWSGPLTVIIGLILASAFPAIVVFAQELVPGKVGMISGLFFGFSFGMGGLGAAGLGWLADHSSIEMVFRVCAFLPAIGLLTAFLPNLGRERN